ncbi:MAG: sodium-translocating pyrophosphatase [Candidatus Micrarchaeota archaeon]|nr:sodium-translocating pyrophosphatase [Candidatus Micrarchaeota archaeon]
MQFYYYSLLAGIASVLFAIYAAMQVLKKPEGTPKMREIAKAIKEGASAYLNRQLQVIAVFAIVLGILFGIFLPSGLQIVLAFAVGAVASYLTAYLGMNVAVRANIRTAKSAENGVKEAFWTAILGGSVTGFAAIGFALVGLSVLLIFLTVSRIAILIGFGFGASLISLFARVGGGIYTKAADVGADLVGKTELNLPEDDPRNPAVIADNVGDNVGDCAGMAADVFESYAVTLVAALLIAAALASSAGSATSFYVTNGFAYPLYVAILGFFGSLVSIPILGRFGRKPNKALYMGMGSAVIVSALLDLALVYAMHLGMGAFIPVLSGLILAMLLFWVADYYTGSKSKSVIKIANASRSGAGTNVITGLAVGLRSTWMPVLFIVIAILVSYYTTGVYGIGIAAVGMLSLTATVLTIDSFGPITDNAGGIAEMASLPSGVRKVTDQLDALGNTTKATTKAYAIGGAALSATALLVAFAQATHLTAIDAINPSVMVGVFIGALIPFVFSSFLMESVGYAANLMVEEVRRQVKTIKGLLQGTAKPDYAKAVDIATINAIKSLAIPELIAIVTPIAVGLILGKAALGGLLVGMIPASLMLALFMANGGAAMDNAKKYIESGKFGGKGSDAHKAAVVGDTLGDPLKDTAGPALNSMIKVVSTISILLAPVFLVFTLIH